MPTFEKFANSSSRGSFGFGEGSLGFGFDLAFAFAFPVTFPFTFTSTPGPLPSSSSFASVRFPVFGTLGVHCLVYLVTWGYVCHVWGIYSSIFLFILSRWGS